MNIQWLALLMVWSISTTSVLLLEISSANPSIMSVQASHYLTADTNLKHVEPGEELRRTQRSFLKKLWKNTWLQDLFSDRGCVTCCNNNEYNVGEGDIFQSPPNPSYNTCFQQLPPLPSFQPLHPLWMFQPLLRPTCLNSNGPKRGGYVNNYDGSNTPSKCEAGNAIQNGYGDGYINSHSKIIDGSSYKNLNENKAYEYGNHGQEKINSNSDTSGTSSIKNTSNIKNGYINVKSPHKEPYQNIKIGSGEVFQHKEVKAASSGTYPSSHDADKPSSLVYQPIIYVSPQYQLATPSYSSSYSSNEKPVITQINKSAEVNYPEIKYHSNKYTGTIPTYSEYSSPNNLCSNGFEYSCSLAPAMPPFYNSLLPNSLKNSEQLDLQFPSLAPASKYLSSDEALLNHPAHSVSPHNSFLTNCQSPSTMPSIPSAFEGGSVYGDPNPASRDIAVYTIVKQIPHAFTSTLKPNTFDSATSSNSYFSPMNELFNEPAIPPLSELDQPYRNCPELFTNYLNQINNNQNRAKANTFVNAQFISC